MKLRKLVASTATALLIGGGLAVASALPAAAHTPDVSATCDSLIVTASNYETKPSQGEPTIVVDNPDYVPAIPEVPAVGTPTILVPNPGYIPAIPEVPEILGDPPLISPEVLEATKTENEYKQIITGKTKWIAADDWNPGFGWYATGNYRVVVVTPYQPAIYGPQPVIQPYQPAVPAVGEPQIEVPNPAYVPAIPGTPAVGEPTITVANPDYVAADETPNSVEIIVDGDSLGVAEFGTGGEWYVPLDGDGHDYTVKFTAWNDPNGSKGWTKTISGSTEPCEVVVPEKPEDEVIFGEWSTPTIDCDTEVDDELTIEREVSTVSYTLVDNKWVAGEPVVTTETDTYVVTETDIEALECPVTPPAEEPEEPQTPTETPLPSGGDDGDLTLPASADVAAEELAQTGSDSSWIAWTLGGGSLLLAGLAISLWAVARRNIGGPVRSGQSE